MYGDDQTDKSYREAQGLFKSYPNLKAIVAPTTVGIAAAGKAVVDEKRVGQVYVTGLGLPSEMAGHVKSGAVKSFAIWNPIDLGYSSIYAAHAFVKGTVKGTKGEQISSAAWARRHSTRTTRPRWPSRSRTTPATSNNSPRCSELSGKDAHDRCRPDAVASLRGIHKRFGPTHALRGVDLDLVPGEALALIGENGAGKSTLVKTLTGVHAPDDGEILVEGRPCPLPARLRRAGRGHRRGAPGNRDVRGADRGREHLHRSPADAGRGPVHVDRLAAHEPRGPGRARPRGRGFRRHHAGALS